MKLFPVRFLLWSSLLVSRVLLSGTEGSSLNFCQEKNSADNVQVQTDKNTESDYADTSDLDETFVCLLYPSNHLNCSWSFHTLQEDSQLSVQISVCNDSVEVNSQEYKSVEREGSATLYVPESGMSSVVLHLNTSRHGEWKTYTCVYEKDIVDLLHPPSNVSASVKDKNLSVTWGLPRSRVPHHHECFEYQLDMGDQNEYRTITGHLSYNESNADPTRAYRLRMRARISEQCYGCTEWSDWSHAVVVEQSHYTLNPLVVVLLSLGIHLILLAVLLLLRHFRVLELLFPPIPRPPPKYKYFLEKSDGFNFFHPAMTARSEEEITEVEDIEKKKPDIF
ncbi:unnamed protein product [Ophioblennius macclurei]